MSAEREARRAVWCRRTLVFAAVGAGALLLSGALAAVYFRPYGHRAPSHIGLAVSAVAILRAVHRGAAVLLVAGALAAGVLGRAWRRAARRARPEWVAAAAVGLVTLITGWLVPWANLLPWTPAIGPNLARPVPLLGYEGPFAELVGVNLRYDDAVLALGKLRLGPKGVGRLYFGHLVVLPSIAVGVVWGVGRRRRRVGRVTEERVHPGGRDPTSGEEAIDEPNKGGRR